MRRLALFDIDKTMADISPLHEQAYREMFREKFGIDSTYTDLPIEHYAGRTTEYIIKEILRRNGFDTPTIEQRFPEAKACLDEKLNDQIETAKKARHGKDFLLPGVEGLLNIMRTSGFNMAAYSGNFKRTADAILNFTHLDHIFPVTAFVDEGNLKNRTDIMKLVYERSKATYGWDFTPSSVVVVGDSIYDVRSANKMGFLSVAVATGPYKKEVLEREGAKLAFQNLSESDNIMKQILKYL